MTWKPYTAASTFDFIVESSNENGTKRRKQNVQMRQGGKRWNGVIERRDAAWPDNRADVWITCISYLNWNACMRTKEFHTFRAKTEITNYLLIPLNSVCDRFILNCLHCVCVRRRSCRFVNRIIRTARASFSLNYKSQCDSVSGAG